MILKGSQRAGGRDLATHLLNEYDNESVELAGLEGTVATDLHGAFAEIDAIASRINCNKPFYSLSISPARPITRAQYFDAIDRAEACLGLSDQPRAVIFHVKNGREHAHVAWSRIDPVTLKGIHISHDHYKLMDLARELARDYGLPLPAGLKERRTGRKKDMSYAEKCQAEETGITPKARQEIITKAWHSADNAAAFIAAMASNGYRLARGERRAFVVLDEYGQIYSLSRQIEGARAKEINKKLAGLEDTLPDAKELQAQIKNLDHERIRKLRQKLQLRKDRELQKLKALHERRRQALTQERRAFEMVHRYERIALHAAQLTEKKSLFNRMASKVVSLALKIPALRSVLWPLQGLPEVSAQERHGLERDALIRRHEREIHIFTRREKALDLIEARELRSLEQKYRRLQRVMIRDGRVRSGRTIGMIRENTDSMTERLHMYVSQEKTNISGRKSVKPVNAPPQGR